MTESLAGLADRELDDVVAEDQADRIALGEMLREPQRLRDSAGARPDRCS